MIWYKNVWCICFLDLIDQSLINFFSCSNKKMPWYLVSDWLIHRYNSPLKLLGKMEPYLTVSIHKVLHTVFLFLFNQFKNIATMGRSCFWLTDTYFVYFPETTSPNGIIHVFDREVWEILYNVWQQKLLILKHM